MSQFKEIIWLLFQFPAALALVMIAAVQFIFACFDWFLTWLYAHLNGVYPVDKKALKTVDPAGENHIFIEVRSWTQSMN